MNLKDFKWVQVVWEDAYLDKPEWNSLEELIKADQCICYSTGYLIRNDNKFVILVGTIQRDEDGSVFGGGRNVIPRSMVLSMREAKYEEIGNVPGIGADLAGPISVRETDAG